jgi:cytoskeletal protein CcmA (bactofilin family)
MRTLALAVVALLLALGPGPARAQPPGGVVIAAGEVRAGDVATLERPIVVEGVVEGDVTSWSGPITVEGEVRGDVVSYVGTITLGPGAHVGGNLLAMAGGIHGEPGAVAGAVLGDEPVAGTPFVASVATILGRQPESAAAEIPRPLLSALLALVSLALSALLAAIWPARSAGAAMALRRAPLRSGALGLLTTLLLALLLPPLASVLALSLVGLPLLVPLLIALQLPYLFGLAAIGRLLAASAGASRLHPALAACGAIVVLLPVAAVGVAAPLSSAALFYLVAGCGLGAAILSRGGAYELGAAR